MSDGRSTDFVLDQFERFVTTIAGMDVPEGGFEDADIVKATSETINEIQDLRAENQALRQELAELERVIAPDPEAESYEDMSREQKVFKLRTALVSRARDNGGHARMKYGDVKWLFDDHPSPGHTYDLMKLAGNADGFDYNDATGEKRVTVDIGDVNDDAVIRAANKTPQEQPA